LVHCLHFCTLCGRFYMFLYILFCLGTFWRISVHFKHLDTFWLVSMHSVHFARFCIDVAFYHISYLWHIISAFWGILSVGLIFSVIFFLHFTCFDTFWGILVYLVYFHHVVVICTFTALRCVCFFRHDLVNWGVFCFFLMHFGTLDFVWILFSFCNILRQIGIYWQF
jgi:hypothetical protein